MISGKQFTGLGQQELFSEHDVVSGPPDESGLSGKTRSGRDINDYEWWSGTPHGYYKQSSEQQQSLPGMERTPQEHVQALGSQHGLRGTIEDDGDNHVISLHDEHHTVAQLYWAKKGQPKNKEGYGYKDGEIGMVAVVPEHRKAGIASGMLHTAESIAKENPEFSTPKHSASRSKAGVAWSQAKMADRGQEIW